MGSSSSKPQNVLSPAHTLLTKQYKATDIKLAQLHKKRESYAKQILKIQNSNALSQTQIAQAEQNLVKIDAAIRRIQQ